MSGPPPPRPRARARAIAIGARPTGPTNSIVDVPGVRVGHVTRWEGETTRTGVTAVVPGDPADVWWRPMTYGTAVLNGTGELTGSFKAAEWGQLETPILLTSTGAVVEAVEEAALDALCVADTVAGFRGHTAEGLPLG